MIITLALIKSNGLCIGIYKIYTKTEVIARFESAEVVSSASWAQIDRLVLIKLIRNHQFFTSLSVFIEAASRFYTKMACLNHVHQ